MTSRQAVRGLVVSGLILLVLALVDPLEGSILTVPGVGAVAAAAFLGHSRFRNHAYWAAALLVLGVSAMWIVSALGGFGGDTGRSMLWAIFLLPYPIGWFAGLVIGIRVFREAFQPSTA